MTSTPGPRVDAWPAARRACKGGPVDIVEDADADGPARGPRRDRDAEGRPRQARPRDDLGRPLPYGAAGAPPVDETPRPPAETIAAANALLAAGRPFAAHETYEVAWKHRPSEERDLWQGLAQVCAGLTHAARGNADGAARLVERGAERLTAYVVRGGPTYDLDLLRLVADARRTAGSHRTSGS